MKGLWLVVAAWAWCAAAAEPELKWVYEAQSQLYAAPLAADLHASPGQEIIISDSDARRLRCIDATGKPLWEYDGEWTKRLTSGAALSTKARPGEATLAVGNSDGSVDAIDAKTGTRLWKMPVGRVEWSNVVWTDIDADLQDELVVGSEETGLTALKADGSILWTYAGREGDPRLSVRGSIAAADVDADAAAEIFACGKWGPLCVGGRGTLRWQASTGDDFYESSVIVVDLGVADRPPVCLCTSGDGAFLHAFDARNGTRLWSAPLLAAPDDYAAPAVAVGDIDGAGAKEIVLSDEKGQVQCFDSDGVWKWTFTTDKATHAAVTLADVDGDGRIEALVASGDHSLYCLDHTGRLEWQHKADLRLIAPATVADVDLDGKTDLLLCGGDHKLRCLTLGAYHAPGLMPWPSRRFDAAQSGSSLGAPEPPRKVEERRPLIANGGFEVTRNAGRPEDFPKDSGLFEQRAGLPQGWSLIATGANAAECRVDTEVKREGNQSFRTKAAEGPVIFSTEFVQVEPDAVKVEASIWAKTKGKPLVELHWRLFDGRIESQPLTERGLEDGWKRLAVEHEAETSLRPGRRWVRLVCTVMPEDGETWWDEAAIEGAYESPRTVDVLVNQAGYDVGMPKFFVVQANFLPQEGKEAFVSGGNGARWGAVLYRADEAPMPGTQERFLKVALGEPQRIKGAFDNDWGHYYWRGEFTGVDEPGRYILQVVVGKMMARPVPIEIGEGRLWAKSARPAYRFFYYQRCGMAIPGYHGACHLDDSTDPGHTQQWDLSGGWHDAGDYNKYHNAPYVLGLAWAYERQQSLFDQQDEDANGKGDFLDEVLWGAEHARKMIAPDGSAYGPVSSGYGFWGPPEIETDNLPLTGDERPTPGPGSDPAVHAAAVAKAAKFTKDASLIEAAARALQYGLDRGQRGPLQLVAAIDMYAATQDDKYAQLAKEIAPTVGGNEVDALELYDRTFGEDHSAIIREALVAEAEKQLANAQNPFGVWTNGPPEKPNFFGTPATDDGWHVGNSERMFQAANRVALAYKYNPDPRYLVYIYDQFNWALGCNPYGVSLIEGVGTAYPPTYHQRLTFAGVERGAIPGGLVNGITFVAPGDDRPYLDMRGIDIPSYESNEVWLPHNTAYLNALTSLQQIHAERGEEP